jgi:hypothetical protein
LSEDLPRSDCCLSIFDVENEGWGVTGLLLGLAEAAGEEVDFDSEENFEILTQVFEDFRRSAR